MPLVYLKQAITHADRLGLDKGEKLLAALDMSCAAHLHVERYLHATKICQRTFDLARDEDESEELVSITDNLAVALLHAGEVDKAVSHFQLALGLARKYWGDHHPHLVGLLEHLAIAWKAKGQPDRTKTYYRWALDILEQNEGSSTPQAHALRQALESL